MSRTAILLGASGLIGSHCLRLLLNHTAYTKVVSIGRRPSGLIHNKLQEVEADFDQLELSAEHFKGDDLYCCLGTTMKKAGSQEAFRKVDQEYVAKAAQIASAHGVQQFLLVSSVGADLTSSNFYLKVKGEVENEVMGLSFYAHHIFRPSMLLGDRKEIRSGEAIGQAFFKAASFLFVGPLRHYKGVKGETVAKTMIHFACDGEAGKHIYENEKILTVGTIKDTDNAYWD